MAPTCSLLPAAAALTKNSLHSMHSDNGKYNFIRANPRTYSRRLAEKAHASESKISSPPADAYDPITDSSLRLPVVAVGLCI
jgi:hypothetical protein